VNNLQRGQVLTGGKININGLLVAQKGSLMDVSGTSATLDIPKVLPDALQIADGALNYQPTFIAGNAGSISVKSVGGALLDGTMKAGVDANTAAGGSFNY
jgi:filamentous hemagglutinin